jgi:hypothetical protein
MWLTGVLLLDRHMVKSSIEFGRILRIASLHLGALELLQEHSRSLARRSTHDVPALSHERNLKYVYIVVLVVGRCMVTLWRRHGPRCTPRELTSMADYILDDTSEEACFAFGN